MCSWNGLVMKAARCKSSPRNSTITRGRFFFFFSQHIVTSCYATVHGYKVIGKIAPLASLSKKHSRRSYGTPRCIHVFSFLCLLTVYWSVVVIIALMLSSLLGPMCSRRGYRSCVCAPLRARRWLDAFRCGGRTRHVSANCALRMLLLIITRGVCSWFDITF